MTLNLSSGLTKQQWHSSINSIQYQVWYSIWGQICFSSQSDDFLLVMCGNCFLLHAPHVAHTLVLLLCKLFFQVSFVCIFPVISAWLSYYALSLIVALCTLHDCFTSAARTRDCSSAKKVTGIQLGRGNRSNLKNLLAHDVIIIHTYTPPPTVVLD